MRVTATCLLTTLVLTAVPFIGGAALAKGAQPDVVQKAPATLDTGEASWYGPRHEGRRTTSGEVFDSRKLTAAHASLPLGTYVRVVVQETGRSIVVKVNDREPPHGVRCIDLSRAAAARLGIVSRGIANVTLEAATRQDAAEELAEAPPNARSIESTHRHHHRRAHHNP